MARKFRRATWRSDRTKGHSERYFLMLFICAAEILLDNGRIDSGDYNRPYTIEELAAKLQDAIEDLPDAEPDGKKHAPVSSRLQQSTNYIAFDLFTPSGLLRFVFNKRTPLKSKEHCYIEFMPKGGHLSNLRKIQHVFGSLDELEVEYTGMSIPV